MIAIRIVAAVAWLGAMSLGAVGNEALTPGPAGHAGLGGGLIAGHFRLTAGDGTIVDSDDLASHPYALLFGFTHCPDVCPTILAELSLALALLPTNDLKVYFVTVDPERDTPNALAQYMTHFDPRIVALTGTRSAVDEALVSHGAVARRNDLPGGGYVYGHTAAIMLIDRNGLIVDRVGPEVASGQLADKLSALASGGARRANASAR